MDVGQRPANAPPPRDVRTVDAGMDIYGVEADDFAATALDGKPPLMSREESLGTMRMLEQVRRQIAKAG